MVGDFGQRPSETHVVWTNRDGEGHGKKRFHFEYLERWADHRGVDYEERTRVDHERAEEPREQHAVVFAWAETDAETFELGDRSWTMSERDAPRTFVEVDEAGDVRVRGWDHESVLDVRELWFDGPVLKLRTVERGTVALDTRKLLESGRGSEA